MDSEVGHSGVGEGGEGEGHSGVGEGGEGEGHSGVGEGGEGHSGEDSTCSGTLEEDASIMSSDSSELVNDSSSGDDLSGDSSDSNSDCEDISNDSTDDPLYPGSCITDHSFNTVFMSIVQRHNLTYASQSDLLKFFSLTLPSPSKVPPVLNGKFVNFKEDAIVQHFCGSCTRPISSGSSCEREQCIRAKLPRAMFVQVPLQMQLRERFEGIYCTYGMGLGSYICTVVYVTQ